MPTHDITTPIPASTFRVSVQWGNDRLFVSDIPSNAVAETVQAFEHFVGPALALGDTHYNSHAATGCCAAAGIAAAAGDTDTVTAAAVWLFLFEPGADRRRDAERLGKMIDANGSALLVATTDVLGVEWRFDLYAMPRWPTVTMPGTVVGGGRRR
jgi:hypothetical protein